MRLIFFNNPCRKNFKGLKLFSGAAIFFIFISWAVHLLARTEFSLPELITESMPEIPDKAGDLSGGNIIKDPILWPFNFWNLPELDGFFRYPVQTLTFFQPEPSRGGALALKYTFYIKYNKFHVPETIYKYRHRWGMRSKGKLVSHMHFTYMGRSREILIQDHREKTQVRSVLSFKQRKREEDPLLNYFRKTPFSLPTKTYIPPNIRKEMDRLSDFYLLRQEYGRGRQLLWTEFFFYPRNAFRKEIILPKAQGADNIAEQKTALFWQHLRKPALSLTFINRPGYKVLRRIRHFTWDFQKVTLGKNRDGRKNEKDFMKKSGPASDKGPSSPDKSVQFVRRKITDARDNLLYEQFTNYDEEYPKEIIFVNNLGEREYSWYFEYYEKIPLERGNLRPYYETLLQKKNDKSSAESMVQSKKTTKKSSVENLFPPVDMTPGNFWGLEQLLPEYFSVPIDGFLPAWPKMENLPRQAVKRNAMQEVILKVIFDYRSVR